jgi:Peptidase A4 family
MLSNRLGILVLATFVLPAVAQVPSAPITPLTTPVSPLQHRPMKFHRVRLDATVESENWSGYAVTGSGFTQAKGSWTIAAVDCSATPNTYSAFWVGIDGYSSDTVEQTGTIAYCNGSSAEYYAWYEFYPAGLVEITSVPVSPGDKISAEVSYGGSEFTTTITDQATGQSYSKSSRVRRAARSSAEWIAEAPCCTNFGGILPLSDFGTGSFGEDYTSISNTDYATETSMSGPISAFGSDVQQIIMVSSSGAEEAVPSALTSDGTSFQVTWESDGVSAAPVASWRVWDR